MTFNILISEFSGDMYIDIPHINSWWYQIPAPPASDAHVWYMSWCLYRIITMVKQNSTYVKQLMVHASSH